MVFYGRRPLHLKQQLLGTRYSIFRGESHRGESHTYGLHYTWLAFGGKWTTSKAVILRLVSYLRPGKTV
jgi:hypothetical protein